MQALAVPPARSCSYAFVEPTRARGSFESRQLALVLSRDGPQSPGIASTQAAAKVPGSPASELSGWKNAAFGV